MERRLPQEEEFDLQQIIRKTAQYRWLFACTILCCLLLTFIYNRYAVPVYNVKASILIDEEENMSETAELIYGTDILSSSKSLYNEIAVLKSYPFIHRTVRSLNRRVTYFREGRVEDGEIYSNLPFEVLIDSLHYNPMNEDIPLYITILDENHFELEVFAGEDKEIRKKLSFGEKFMLRGTGMQLDFIQMPEQLKGRYYVVINNFEKLARSYKNRLSIYPYSKESSVIDISIETSVPQKEIDFLNELTYQYTIVSLEDKNKSTSQSLTFIDEQLQKTFDTLQVIERSLENFKTRNNYSHVNSMLDRSLDKISRLESEKAGLMINDAYYRSIQRYIEDNIALDKLAAPSGLGSQDVLLNNLISQLATLQIEKNTYLLEGSAKNPYIREIEGKINNIKATLNESLQNMIANNQLSLTQVDQRIQELEKEIGALPEAERKYVNIKRLYDLNENVYNLLLQKKVEAGITQASATVDNKVIEPAYLVDTLPSKPRKSRNLVIAVLLGLLLPSAFIFVKEKFDATIENKGDISKFTDLPVIASISKNEKNMPLVVEQAPKSPTAESFRVLRSNLKFTTSSQHGNKTYLVTSVVSGEGKTFCSINLAIALALSGKKTLLLDTDMRKNEPVPGMGLQKDSKGLSNYLVGDAILDEIIQSTSIANLEVISSGPVPPNPSELLMTETMELMMDVLKTSYDYIVIDTSPVGLVTDAQIMMNFAQTNLYIVRQKYTKKDSMKQLAYMKEQKLISNLNIIFNDVKGGEGYFDYGYYYTYPKRKKSVLDKIRTFL